MMTFDQATDFYIEQIDMPHGSDFAATVKRFQEGFLRDRVTTDLDDAFRRAVDGTSRLLPAIIARHAAQ